jgi:hypothetical protein
MTAGKASKGFVSRSGKLRKILVAVVATRNPDVAYIFSPAMSKAVYPAW